VGAITVVLADDHPVVRDGIRADLDERFWVVGEADDAPSTIKLIDRHHPDLVLCDLDMPGGVSEAEADLVDTVAAGALGFLSKRTRGPELRAALLRAAAGEPVFTPVLAGLLIGRFRQLAKTSTAGVEPLTGREREVLVLVARGRTYRAIGAELFISEKTVENHVQRIYRKLQVRGRGELTRYAVDHGLR